MNLRMTESYISEDTIMEIGFSIERLKKSNVLHKMTRKGNILHTLLANYPGDMEDDKAREFMKQLLEIAPQLICQLNSKDKTPLHLIARHRPSLIDRNFRKMIESCFKRVTQDDDMEGLCEGPPWAVKDFQGNTILHLALFDNWPGPWLKEILNFDIDLAKQKNDIGELPLHLLVKRACDPDCRSKYADMVDSDQPTTISRFNWRPLAHPEAVNTTNDAGLTPLLLAARAQELEIFNSVLKCHHCSGDTCELKLTYDGDRGGDTFWHYLASIQVPHNYSDSKWKFLCLGARKALTKSNKIGKTPFHVAIEKGNFKVASMFSIALHIDGPQESVYKDMGDREGNVPLHLVIGRSELPYAREFIECETTSMEVIGVQNNMGLTPLHLAVLKKDTEFLKIIFDVKRNDTAFTSQILMITDKDHNTPLHYAISNGALDFVDMLFDQGEMVQCMDKILDMSNKDGNTPMHLAVLKRRSSLATKFMGTTKENNNIKQILEKCNKEGNTPLHLAIHSQDFDLVKCLIEYAIEGTCIGKILEIHNGNNETPDSLIGSAEHLPSKFEKFFWNEPKVVQAMLGVRSLSGVPTKMIKEYTNTIGVIAALLATITFTAGFTVPGGLNSSSGAPLLMQKPSFQVFMVSDIIAMCLSMMVLFFLMWIMAINDEKHQVILLDLTVFSLQGAFFATILTFMTGLYASVFPSTHWIAIFACVLCSLLIVFMHKRLIILFIPGFIHIYVWYQKVKKLCGHIACCWSNNQNNGETSGTPTHANDPTEPLSRV